MIVALLTFAVSGSVFAAHSLVAKARADHSRLGTTLSAAKSVARAAKLTALRLAYPINVNVVATQQARALAPVVSKAAARRKACTLKV